LKKTSFKKTRCPIARTLDILGEWWTILILREAFEGSRQFGEFQKNLNIPKNILTERLGKLVKHRILRRTSLNVGGKRFGYFLTDKGNDILPIIAALRYWGKKYVPADSPSGLKFIDRRDGSQVEFRMELISESGRHVPFSQLTVLSK